MLGEADARALTVRIQATAEDLWQLVVVAYQGRAWEALGYPSWDAYCASEFKDMKIRLPKQDRREIVQTLRDHGLSLRAMASATGYDKHTIARDLAASSPTAKPAGQQRATVGVNGKRYCQPSPSQTIVRASCTIAKMAQQVASIIEGHELPPEGIKESLDELKQSRERLETVIARLEQGVNV